MTVVLCKLFGHQWRWHDDETPVEGTHGTWYRDRYVCARCSAQAWGSIVAGRRG